LVRFGQVQAMNLRKCLSQKRNV